MQYSSKQESQMLTLHENEFRHTITTLRSYRY